jgi:hypothetical protein
VFNQFAYRDKKVVGVFIAFFVRRFTARVSVRVRVGVRGEQQMSVLLLLIGGEFVQRGIAVHLNTECARVKSIFIITYIVE